MRASLDPQTALRLLREEHAAVRELIDTLSADEMTRPDTVRYGLYPGQHYSFKDLLAHLHAYEVHALDALAAWRRGEKHSIVDRVRSQGRAVHFASTADYEHLSLDEMIAAYNDTADALETVYETMDADEWAQPAPYGDPHTTLGGMLETIVVAPPRPMYRHLPVHIPDAARYVRRLRG